MSSEQAKTSDSRSSSGLKHLKKKHGSGRITGRSTEDVLSQRASSAGQEWSLGVGLGDYGTGGVPHGSRAPGPGACMATLPTHCPCPSQAS